MTDPTTQDLQLEQMQREVRERRHAREAGDENETRQHDRRAAKAAYLGEQLEKRAESEERVEGDS